MTIPELKAKIEALGYPPEYYSLDGHDVDGIVLTPYPDGTWRVYRLDYRGPVGDAWYYTESEACQRVWEYVQRDAKSYPEEVLAKYRKVK